MTTHTCPSWCHRCPLLNGPDGNRQVMPMCIGTAACGDGPYDLSRCLCVRTRERPPVVSEIASLEERVRRLEAKVEALTGKE